MSTLYAVATPIGNLKDMTYRAVEVLKDVDVIAAEDTRCTSNLLKHYNITQKKLISFHSHNELNSTKGIIKMLDDGLNVAICTDAGTPCISDPGARLVEALKSTEHKVVPIPGASAATCLVSIAGNCGKEWLFEGFLPKTAGKQKKQLEKLLSYDVAFIIYESPFRILKLLNLISSLSPKRNITLAREMTKMHEEIISASAKDMLKEFEKRDNIKGEFALLVHPEYEKADNIEE